MATNMSGAMVRASLHTFCERFSDEMFNTWIKLPVGDDLKTVMPTYDNVGFTGAVGSTDVIHVE